MTDTIVPFYRTESERQRQVFLAGLVDALDQTAGADLTVASRLLAPLESEPGPRYSGLVVTAPVVPGEVRVLPVVLIQRTVTTRAGGDDPLVFNEPALERMRQFLRQFGIASVAGSETRYDPFPGAGQPAYQLTMYRPDRRGHDPGALIPVAHHTVADAAAAARLIVAWRNAHQASLPAGPRDAASLAPLRALADARRSLRTSVDLVAVDALRRAGRLTDAWRLARLVVDGDDPDRLVGADLAPTVAARADLQADLAALLPLNLVWHFPRDDQGRLALGEIVLLASYESAVPLARDRHLWLCAQGPARRRDPQVVTLRLAALIGDNQSHNWARARWLWDERAQATPPRERWGVDGLPLADLGLGASAPQSVGEALATASLGGRVAACLCLQDAGRLEAALALFGVTMTPEVADLLAGRWHDESYGQRVGDCVRAVQEAVRASAPWQFEPLLRRAAAERERWAGEKRSRRWTPPTLRLCWLPHQTWQAKDAIVLRAGQRDGGQPRLEVARSSNNDRLPLIAWRRPVEIDLLRFGLLGEDEVV